jgi:hypothetical protein
MRGLNFSPPSKGAKTLVGVEELTCANLYYMRELKTILTREKTYPPGHPSQRSHLPAWPTFVGTTKPRGDEKTRR